MLVRVLTKVHVARLFSTVPAGSAKEAEISALLTDKLQAHKVTIKDVSGGCGAFYEISVVSALFQGKTTIQQHRQVNSVLGPIIGTLHGLTLKTSVPTTA
jgi:stress-induced morphogen